MYIHFLVQISSFKFSKQYLWPSTLRFPFINWSECIFKQMHLPTNSHTNTTTLKPSCPSTQNARMVPYFFRFADYQTTHFFCLTFQLSANLVTTLLTMESSHAWNAQWTHTRIMTSKPSATHAQQEPIRRAPEVRHWRTACVSNSFIK